MAMRNSTPLGRQSVTHICGERRIKVGRGFYESRRRNKVSGYTPQPVPWIRLQGQWLERAGFVIDARLTVHVRCNCLVLTVDRDVVDGNDR